MTKTQQKIPHPDKYQDWQPFNQKLGHHEARDYPLSVHFSIKDKLKLFDNKLFAGEVSIVKRITQYFLHPIKTIKAFIEIFFPHFYDKHINKIYTYDPTGFGFQEKYQKPKKNKK